MTRVSMLVGVGLSPGGRLERGCTEHAGGAPAYRSLCHFCQHAHNVAVMQALDACNVYIESIKEEVEGAHTRQICLRQATYAGPAIAAAALPGSNISRQNLILSNFLMRSNKFWDLSISKLKLAIILARAPPTTCGARGLTNELLACSNAAGETDVH